MSRIYNSRNYSDLIAQVEVAEAFSIYNSRNYSDLIAHQPPVPPLRIYNSRNYSDLIAIAGIRSAVESTIVEIILT